MTWTEQQTDTATRVADRVAPAVVAVGRDRRGAGVVVDAGVVVTNAHNLRGETVTVSFADGRTETAAVSGVDADGDLAVVAVDTGDVEPVEWGIGELALGTPVVGVALAPSGAPRVTFGAVSSTNRSFRGPRGRRISGSVEHTAPLARGSSGGPLVDVEGRLVAVNTHRLPEGFYLARPVDDDVRKRVDQLRAGEEPSRRRLGVAVVPPEVSGRLRRAVGLDERAGVLVRGVDPDGPAAAAGVQEGDLLVGAGSTAIASVDDLHDALEAAGADPVELRVVRGVQELLVTVEA